MPVWNWFDCAYKVRAAKATTNIAQMNLDDTREKIHLQIAQSQFKVKEAQKKLNMAMRNIASAEETSDAQTSDSRKASWRLPM